MNEEEDNFMCMCKSCFKTIKESEKEKHINECSKEEKNIEEFNIYLENLNDLFKDYKKLKKLNEKMLKKINIYETQIKNNEFKVNLVSSFFEKIKGTSFEDDLYKINNLEITWNCKAKESPNKEVSPSESRKVSPNNLNGIKNKGEGIRLERNRSAGSQVEKYRAPGTQTERYISAQKLTDHIVNEKTEEEKKEIVQEVEKKLLETSKKYFDEDKETILNIIKDRFNLFQKEKTISHLKVIKDKRPKLLKFVGYEDYIKILENHLKKLECIIDKNLDQNKKYYLNCFSVLDSRLLNLNCWNNESINLEEIERFHIGLEKVKNEFELFSIQNLMKSILTYDLALSGLKQILKREIPNKAGFHNLIFIIKGEIEGKVIEINTEDPYSFYTLEKTEKKFRFWRMDCRLEEVTHELRNNILKYCIEQFRKLYFLIFNDNTLREDYFSYSPIFELEAEQILQNIQTVNNFYKFNKIVKEIVKEHCFYTPSIMDKFHLYGDDKIQQRNFKKLSEYDYTPELIDNLMQLFDDPTEEELKKVFKNLF
jgi:hypothetical protein